MGVNIRGVIRGALAGWAGMTGIVMAGRRVGLTQMSVMEMEGSLFAPPRSTRAKVIGSLTHLGLSLWIGLVYALGFRLASIRPDWKTGAGGSLVHWVIATIVTGVASTKHPRRQETAMLGFGGMTLGVRSAVGFLVSHVVYGALFGWQYGRSRKQ